MDNFKLYELNDMLEKILDEIYYLAELNEGELSDEWWLKLDSIKLDREKKVLDIARYIKSLNYKADIIKAEIDQLSKRYRVYTNHSERLKNYLIANIDNNEYFEDGNTKLSWRKSSRVIVDNEKDIPNYYFKTTKTPQLAAIKKDIQLGAIINGAHIEEINNLQIR